MARRSVQTPLTGFQARSASDSQAEKQLTGHIALSRATCSNGQASPLCANQIAACQHRVSPLLPLAARTRGKSLVRSQPRRKCAPGAYPGAYLVENVLLRQRVQRRPRPVHRTSGHRRVRRDVAGCVGTANGFGEPSPNPPLGGMTAVISSHSCARSNLNFPVAVFLSKNFPVTACPPCAGF
jgi:hypothetical protein